MHLTPGFPAHSDDDVCIPALQDFIESLAERSAAEHHRVVSLHYPQRRSSYLWKGVRVHTVGCRANLAVRLWDWRRALGLLEKLHTEQRIDVLHAYFLSDAALVATRFAAQTGVPLVLTAMGQDVLPANRYLGLLHRRVNKLGSCVCVAPSKRCAGLLRQTGLGKQGFGEQGVQVVPWGVRSFDAGSHQIERGIDLLGVGSLTVNKDFEQLIRLGHRLKDHSELEREVRIVLLGDGPERRNLEALVSDLGLSSYVEIRGQCTRQEAREAMAMARVLVHPSRYESFGLVFAEAAAAGMCIVSRAVGCAPERGILGWSVFDDPAGLPGLVLAGLSTPAPRVKFPVEETCRAYEAIYAEVATRGVVRVD